MAEFVDYLKFAVENEVKKFVESISPNHPEELKELGTLILIDQLTDHATAILRGQMYYAIDAACYEFLISIRSSKQRLEKGERDGTGK